MHSDTAVDTLQSFSQLEKSYNKTIADIIGDASQSLMFIYVAPSVINTAKKLSEILGTETILSGGMSKSSSGMGSDRNSATYTMMKRPLMIPDEIIRIKMGNLILINGRIGNMKIELPYYLEYLPKNNTFESPISYGITEDIPYLTSDHIQRRARR